MTIRIKRLVMSNPEETVDIYERLADALDPLPHGFPRTPSGVEWEEMRLKNLAATK